MNILRAIALFLSAAAGVIGVVANLTGVLGYFGMTPHQFNDMRPSFISESIWHLPDPRRAGGEDFDSLYQRAKDERDHNHFTDAIHIFQQALRRSDTTAKQQASAYGGIGYSYLRLDRYSEAQAAVQKALALQPDDVGPKITQIKIACAQKAPADEIGNEFTALRAAIPADSWQQQRLERDEELFLMCAYAGAKPKHID